MRPNKKWTANSTTSSQHGWLLRPEIAGSAKKKQHLVGLPPTTSTLKSGWALSTALPRSSHTNAESVVFSRTSDALSINCHKLSVYLMDELAEKGLDWISLLTNNWQLEIFNTDLLGVKNFQNDWKQKTPSVETLVKLTQKATYYPVVVTDETYWSYTCCLQVAELGRVRFLVCFPESENCEKYAALITNRLDWSPRKVISQYLQLPIWPKLLERPASLSISKKPSLQLV